MPGKRKRGGYRTLLATNRGDRWFYLYGFGKSERGNVDRREEAALRSYAAILLALTGAQLDVMVKGQALLEIGHEQREDQASPGEPPAGRDP